MFGTVWEAITNILLELGPVGMILIAMLDSSLLSISEINGVIVVPRNATDGRPLNMPPTSPHRERQRA
mgnify:CR=1 FL=1